MERFSQWERGAALERMAEGVEVLVIGGGITGVSVAMDAAARGWRVGLVEKGDFASATSSKSTKLVHGGIRYLPQFDFALVREALEERRLLFQNAPWLVQPLSFVLPLYGWNKKPLGMPFTPPGGIGMDWMMAAGLELYDRLAGRDNLRPHQRLSAADVALRAPALKPEGLKHAFLYWDGQTDDVRLTLAVLKTAVQQGALAVNYAEVVGLELEEGHIQAAQVQDRRNGREWCIPARHVVNAGGVFAQRIEELTGLPSDLRVEPAKGVHLVVSREAVPMTEEAVVLPETDDGRLLFLIPWEDRVIVGTTDTVGGDIDRPWTTEDDVAYLLDHCRRYLRAPLTEQDILSVYAGYRPLVQSANKADSARLSRSHAVLDGPGGMISVVGGKLTTWRRMAQDTVNFLGMREGQPPSELTKHMALEGSAGWPLLSYPSGLDADIQRHLGAFYGTNLHQVLNIAAEQPALARRIVEDLPYLMAEIVYACRYEMALTLDDALSRRTRLVLEDRAQALEAAENVAVVMAAELGWDPAETERQVQEYRGVVRDEYQPHALMQKGT